MTWFCWVNWRLQLSHNYFAEKEFEFKWKKIVNSKKQLTSNEEQFRTLIGWPFPLPSPQLSARYSICISFLCLHQVYKECRLKIDISRLLHFIQSSPEKNGGFFALQLVVHQNVERKWVFVRNKILCNEMFVFYVFQYYYVLHFYLTH